MGASLRIASPPPWNETQQSTAGMLRHGRIPSYLRAHTAEHPASASSWAQPGTPGDAPASLRCRRFPTRRPGRRGGLCRLQRSHPAGMWLPGGKAAWPRLAETKGFAAPGGISRGVGAAGAPSERPGCGGRASRAVPQHPRLVPQHPRLVPGEAGTALDAPAGSTAPRRTRVWGQSQPHQGPVNSPRATILRSQSFQEKESSPMDGESRAASRTYAEPRPEPQLKRSSGINQPE